LGRFFAAQSDAFETLEFSERLLDTGSGLVEQLGEEAGFVFSRRSIRNHRTDPATSGGLPIGLGVISFVGDNSPRLLIGSDIEQRLELPSVAGFATGQMETKRMAVEVDFQVNFGRKATA
jgi:hypothetical protein